MLPENATRDQRFAALAAVLARAATAGELADAGTAQRLQNLVGQVLDFSAPGQPVSGKAPVLSHEQHRPPVDVEQFGHLRGGQDWWQDSDRRLGLHMLSKVDRGRLR